MASKHHHDPYSVAAMHAELIGEKNNIVVPRLYLEMTGWDYPAAVVLREVVYWSGDYSQTDERDGWFYRTAADWTRHFGLSWKQVQRALTVINKLDEEPLIEREVRKIRTSDGMVLNERSTFYRLNCEAFSRLLWKTRNRPKGEFGTRPKGESANSPKGDFLTLDPQETYTGDIHRESAPTIDSHSGNYQTPAPETFEPDELEVAWAVQNTGLDRAGVAAETALMLEHYRARGQTFADWRAAWRSWMMRANRYRSGNGSGEGRNRPGRSIGLSNDELDRIARGEEP